MISMINFLVPIKTIKVYGPKPAYYTQCRYKITGVCICTGIWYCAANVNIEIIPTCASVSFPCHAVPYLLGTYILNLDVVGMVRYIFVRYGIVYKRKRY